MTKISIAMATYNGADYITAQLQSFVDQTRRPDELIVCDDSPSDETARIVKAFSQDAPFDVILHRNQQRLGYIRNFEKAALLCTGDLVFFSDQDDVWLEPKLERIEREFAQKADVQVVINDAKLASHELVVGPFTQLGNMRRAGVPDVNFVMGCCSAHRKVWQSMAFPIPNPELPHDLWVNGLAAALQCMSIVDEPLQIYRRHRDNVSQWILSDPGGVSLFRSLKAHALKPGLADLSALSRLNDAMLDRVVERGTHLPESLGNRQPEFAAILKTRQARIAKRIEILGHKRLNRWPQVAKFWMKGGYRDASGWKSALKDVLRPHG